MEQFLEIFLFSLEASLFNIFFWISGSPNCVSFGAVLEIFLPSFGDISPQLYELDTFLNIWLFLWLSRLSFFWSGFGGMMFLHSLEVSPWDTFLNILQQLMFNNLLFLWISKLWLFWSSFGNNSSHLCRYYPPDVSPG